MADTKNPRYTWQALLGNVAKPSEQDWRVYAVKAPSADLIKSGRRISSRKILTDHLAWCGIVADFWPTATASQRKLLRGFSDGLLRVTVYSGKKLLDMVTLYESTTGKRTEHDAVAGVMASEAYKEGIAEREQLAEALSGPLQGDPVRLERLAAARGTIVQPTDVPRSLRNLASFAAELLQDARSDIALQLTEGGINAQVLADIEALAARVETSILQGSGTLTRGPVSIAQLNEQDGICLTYLRRMMRLFELAHDRDPTIPRLVPRATRHVLAPRRASTATSPSAEQDPEPDIEPATTPDAG